MSAEGAAAAPTFKSPGYWETPNSLINFHSATKPIPNPFGLPLPVKSRTPTNHCTKRLHTKLHVPHHPEDPAQPDRTRVVRGLSPSQNGGRTSKGAPTQRRAQPQQDHRKPGVSLPGDQGAGWAGRRRHLRSIPNGRPPNRFDMQNRWRKRVIKPLEKVATTLNPFSAFPLRVTRPQLCKNLTGNPEAQNRGKTERALGLPSTRLRPPPPVHATKARPHPRRATQPPSPLRDDSSALNPRLRERASAPVT